MQKATPESQDELRIIGKKYYGRWISALIVLLILLAVANSVINNPRFEWKVIAENLTEASILQGVLMTLQLTVISVVLGFAGGTVLALMRLSSNP
jgi:polar amino acid transport system permease protein